MRRRSIWCRLVAITISVAVFLFFAQTYKGFSQQTENVWMHRLLKQDGSQIGFNSSLIYESTGKNPILDALRKSISNSSSVSYDDMHFLMGAYLVDNQTIQITAIYKCKHRIDFKFFLQNDDLSILIPVAIYFSRLIHYCPWSYAKKCDMVGYFITLKIPQSVGKTTELSAVKSVGVQNLKKRINETKIITLYDSRLLKNRNRHKLAVCLQPVFLLADWTLFVQFFEINKNEIKFKSWIAKGATKFYIYVQSMAPEVDRLLRIYEQDKSISVERISWAPLPAEDVTKPKNPNNRVYRTEVVTAINDCVLRAKGHAEYVISSDLDEIIVVFKQPLLKFIDEMAKKRKNLGAIIIRSSYALWNNDWRNNSSPYSLNFDSLSNVLLEDYAWPEGKRSKVVMVPEKILATHVHNTIKLTNLSKRFSVAPEIARVFHLRRVFSGEFASPFSNASTSDALKKIVSICNKNWKNRLKSTGISAQESWPNRGVQVINELEKCRLKTFAKRDTFCDSSFRCINTIKAVAVEEWVWANQTWSHL